MRYPLLTLISLTPMLLSACSDSTGPTSTETLIRVRVDWPMAREATFSEATLLHGTLCASAPCPTGQPVEFDANGLVELEWTSSCTRGDHFTLKYLRVRGQYEHRGDIACAIPLAPNAVTGRFVTCTDEVQHFLVERPDSWECQPPPAQ
jgi:hypothetical protein